jgi:hypothetical protein
VSVVALSLALAMHPRFRWRGGMRTAAAKRRIADKGPNSIAPMNARPDLGDDSTAGALLVDLLAADPSLHVHRDGPRYIVHCAPGIAEHHGATLGEAVALALLAVWGPA